jgi:hypothetical protein
MSLAALGFGTGAGATVDVTAAANGCGGTDGVGEVVDLISSPWEGVSKPHTTLA